MKRILFCLMVALAFVGCTDEGPDDGGSTGGGSTQPQTTITLTTTALNFTTEGGSQNVTFTSSGDWTAQVLNDRANDWCKLTPASGAAGNGQITVTAAANATTDERSASIVLKSGTVQKTIKVTQKQKDALTVTASKFEVAAEGGTVAIEVKANIDFSYAVDGASQSWIKYQTTRAMKTSTLVFDIAENDSRDKRQGTVTISSGALKEVVTIYQEGAKPAIVISKSEYVIGSEGGSVAVEVKSNVDVSVELPSDVEWLSESTTRAMSTNTYYFDVAENTGYDQRSATIVFTNKADNLTEEVTITQAQKDAIVLAKDNYVVDSEGDVIVIEVGHNVDFDVEIADSWITQDQTRTFVNDVLTFTVAKNTGYDNRESTIKFISKDKSITQIAKVYQAQSDALIVSKKDIVIGDEGGTIDLVIQSNVEFTVSDPNVSWVHSVATRALTTTTLQYEVDANTSYDQRVATLIVTNTKTKATEEVTITQTQKDAIVLAKSEYEIGLAGGELDFEIQTNVDVTVKTSATWIKQVTTRALESKMLLFDIAANSAEEDREGTIAISGGDVAQTIIVKQSNIQPSNEIWYTSIGEELIVPNFTNTSDINIVYNTYINGKGIIKFDAPITDFSCFHFCFNKYIKTIYLPETLSKGPDYNPFICCENLEAIFSPYATKDNRSLVYDGKLVSIAPYGIEEYTTPDGVTSIGSHITEGSKLKKIIISEGVEQLDNHAISGGDANGMPYSFGGEKSVLEYVYLPKSLKTIEYYPFIDQTSIKAFYGDCEFISDDNMSIIVDNKLVAYASGSNLTEYIIPEGVEFIENYAFYHATNLNKIHFPESIMDIASSSSFEGTTNIETISGKYVLADNKSLVRDGVLLYVAPVGLKEYITPSGVHSLNYGVFDDKNELENVVISDEVTAVDSYGYLFHRCKKLKTVIVSANLQYMGYDPWGFKFFNGYGGLENQCEALEKVYMRAINPPKIITNFPNQIVGAFDKLTIYVPRESLELYEKSIYWTPYIEYLQPYDYPDLPALDYYISTDYSQDGVVTTLQTATKGAGIDIVLMGDAYSDRQIADGTYKADMENLYNNLFTEEPYKSFKDHFNVHYVNVVSATEGYDYGNTALSGYFGNGTHVGGNDGAAFNYALNAISEEEMDEALLIVAMNSNNYAGTCYMYYPQTSLGYGNGVSVAYFPKGGDQTTFAQLLHHEACGHGFAKLADEYAYESMGAVPSEEVTSTQSQQTDWGWWKNVDFTSDVTAVRWAKFISDSRYANEKLGAYEGAMTYWSGVWRPTENSIMRHNTGGFNAPSREAIYYRIHKLAYGDEWTYDYETFVKYDEINRTTTTTTQSVPMIYKPTVPPVVMQKNWRDELR